MRSSKKSKNAYAYHPFGYHSGRAGSFAMPRAFYAVAVIPTLGHDTRVTAVTKAGILAVHSALKAGTIGSPARRVHSDHAIPASPTDSTIPNRRTRHKPVQFVSSFRWATAHEGQVCFASAASSLIIRSASLFFPHFRIPQRSSLFFASLFWLEHGLRGAIGDDFISSLFTNSDFDVLPLFGIVRDTVATIFFMFYTQAL